MCPIPVHGVCPIPYCQFTVSGAVLWLASHSPFSSHAWSRKVLALGRSLESCTSEAYAVCIIGSQPFKGDWWGYKGGRGGAVRSWADFQLAGPLCSLAER